MVHPAKTHRQRKQHELLPQKQKTMPSAVTESAARDVVERPDGFYWSAKEGLLEFGPYETYELASSARESTSEEALAPIETLHQAEREMDITDWIAPQTGSVPEGSSPPHIAED